MKRLKVLASAFYCEPGKGSEEGVGWNTVREVAGSHDVWVLTRVKNQTSIEAEMSRRPIPGLRFVYCDLPPWDSWWARGQLLEWHLYYYLWQIYIYFVAQALHRTIRFDLIHHITFVKYWIPSFLSLLPVPFIWGPVGGGETTPRSFRRSLRFKAKISEGVRDLARRLGEHDPFVASTTRRSTIALATTEETAARMTRLGAKDVQIFSQSGLPVEEIELLRYRGRNTEGPLRFVSIGRLLHWKGFHLGLRAFARANLAHEVEYWIIGDGPERGSLEALAFKLGVEDRVKFWGALSREETLTMLKDSHVLIHPSMHDSGGLVCLEAMAAGCPVVCLQLGGPDVLVTEETGLKVPATDPEQAEHDLSGALSRLARDTDLRGRMGEAARRRVEEVFNWEAKGKTWQKFYDKALESTSRHGLD